jgi:hypothetical protein
MAQNSNKFYFCNKVEMKSCLFFNRIEWQNAHWATELCDISGIVKVFARLFVQFILSFQNIATYSCDDTIYQHARCTVND